MEGSGVPRGGQGENFLWVSGRGVQQNHPLSVAPCLHHSALGTAILFLHFLINWPKTRSNYFQPLEGLGRLLGGWGGHVQLLWPSSRGSSRCQPPLVHHCWRERSPLPIFYATALIQISILHTNIFSNICQEMHIQVFGIMSSWPGFYTY